MLRLPRVHVYTGERAERPDRSKRDLREREINLHHLITGAITGVLYVCLDGQGFTGLQRRRGEFRRDVLEFGIAQTVAKDVILTLPGLRPDPEFHVALQRSGRYSHRHEAGSRAGRDQGLD